MEHDWTPRQVMSTEQAHADAKALLAADESVRVINSDRIVYHRHLVRRVYTCDTCGHETPLIGGALPEPARCFIDVGLHVTADGRTSRLCGGRLRCELLPAPAYR